MRTLIVVLIVLFIFMLTGCGPSKKEDGTDKTVGDYILEELMDD